MKKAALYFLLINIIVPLCYADADISENRELTFSQKVNAKPLNDQTINAIMDYEMANVIVRCKKDYHYTDEDMVILERELKRYFTLSLCKDAGTGMYSKDVDNLWHTFLLFTHEYAQFCNKHIGFFVHHTPEINNNKTPEEMTEMHKDFQAFITNYEAMFKEEINSVWFLDMIEAQHSNIEDSGESSAPHRSRGL